MSLYSSLYTGVSGMQTTSQELSVVGDNVANANTIGFKQSRAVFSDILGQNLASGSGETGLGSRLQAVQKILTQGALTQTGLATDLALQGEGFFVVEGPSGENFYTRAGQFTVDQDGYMVNLDGMQVQGYQADTTGAVGGSFGDLLIGDANYPPQATSTLTMRGNLDAGDTPAGPFDVTDPENTSNHSQSMTVFDSLGNAHDVTVYFSMNATGDWEYNVLDDGANLAGGTAGTPEIIASGALTYGTNGELTDHVPNAAVTFNPVGATAPQALTFDFGTPTSAGGTGVDGMTQFGRVGTSVQFVNQDGFAAGDLSQIVIDDDGTIQGAFTNGQTRALGQVAVADFSAADQLMRAGGNLYSATAAAGEANVGAAGSGGRGRIVAGALEQSNVDLASEFVRMIVAQRGFQANSKTVTTSDQLLETLIQTKR